MMMTPAPSGPMTAPAPAGLNMATAGQCSLSSMLLLTHQAMVLMLIYPQQASGALSAALSYYVLLPVFQILRPSVCLVTYGCFLLLV
jgi:hypothetical protein